MIISISFDTEANSTEPHCKHFLHFKRNQFSEMEIAQYIALDEQFLF